MSDINTKKMSPLPSTPFQFYDNIHVLPGTFSRTSIEITDSALKSLRRRHERRCFANEGRSITINPEEVANRATRGCDFGNCHIRI